MPLTTEESAVESAVCRIDMSGTLNNHHHHHHQTTTTTTTTTMPSSSSKKNKTKESTVSSKNEEAAAAGGGGEDNTMGESRNKIDFLKDKIGHQTMGRRIAMHLSTRYSWYNPQLNKKEDDSDDDDDDDDGNDDDDNGEEQQQQQPQEEEGPVSKSSKTKKKKKKTSKRVSIEDPEHNIIINNNNNKKKKKPSIAEAWAFFEHVTLDRYEVPQNHRTTSMVALLNEGQAPPLYKRILNKFHKGERKLEMAEPGENEIPTKLYSPFNTPLSQMGDFGQGYGLYFSTLRAFAILSLLAGLINIPNLVYFSSDNYSFGKNEYNLSPFLAMSAICTDKSWVPCPNCTCEQFDTGTYPSNKIIWGIKDVNNETETTTSSNSNGTATTNTTTISTDDTTYSMLDASEYFQVDTSNNDNWKLTYTDESLQQLYEDYKIRYTPGTRVSSTDSSRTGNCQCEEDETATGTPTTMDFEGYGIYTCTCTHDCFSEIILCDSNDPCIPYVNLSAVEPIMPDYGNAEIFTFVERNNCDGATRQQGFVNLATIFFFFIGAFLIRMKQQEMAIKFDEDEQTAQDYSINILNPPDDSHDPDEWKIFFEKNFADCHVTVVTVDMDNDHVLKLFIERREVLRQIENSIPDGTSLDIETIEQVAKISTRKGNFLTNLINPIPSLVSKLKEVNEKIKTELTKGVDYPVTNIFVTFETEKAQRNVLQTLTVGTVAAHNNDTTKLPAPRFLFRGKYVLEVDEPEEPTSIRWDNLNATKSTIVIRLVITLIITGLWIFISVVIVRILYLFGTLIATTMTTVLTSAFPMIATAMTSLEIHRSESSRQKWMFIKIATYYVVLTTILISLVTPFLATLDRKDGSSASGLISAVHALFYSQILISPLLQLADPIGHIDRHFFAPRAKTQELMNLKMRGSEMYLADRYANMIKFLFLMVWYCAVYPGSFFMGAVALFVVYYTDRFSLMRTWARTPQVGSQIAEFAQDFFQPVALLLMTIVSSYFWAGFKYDNLCKVNGTEVDPNYVGDWDIFVRGADQEVLGLTVTSTPDVNARFTIEPGAEVYKYCLQNFRDPDFPHPKFPPLPNFQQEGEEWMTPDQEDVLIFFGRISATVLAVVILMFVYQIITTILNGFRSTYEPSGKDMKKDFSGVKSIDSYIPEKRSNFFTYPLLLCDLEDIDPKLFSWSDPDRPHLYYSVYEDIKEIMDPRDVKVPYVFSDVKYWDPNRDYEAEAKAAEELRLKKLKKKRRKKRKKKREKKKERQSQKKKEKQPSSEQQSSSVGIDDGSDYLYSDTELGNSHTEFTETEYDDTEFDDTEFDSDADSYESSSEESIPDEEKTPMWQVYDTSGRRWTYYSGIQQQEIEECFQGFKNGPASKGSTVVIEVDETKYEIDVLFMKEMNLEQNGDERDIRRLLV